MKTYTFTKKEKIRNKYISKKVLATLIDKISWLYCKPFIVFESLRPTKKCTIYFLK